MFWFVLLLVCVSHSLAQDGYEDYHNENEGSVQILPEQEPDLETGPQPKNCGQFCALSKTICTAQDDCLDLKGYNAITTEKKTYYIDITKKANWHGALRQCRLAGYQLATIPGKAENDALLKFINTKNLQKSSFWIGGTDLASYPKTPKDANVAKGYYWISNGRQIGYNNWSDGEPNNGGTSLSEHCMEMNYNGEGRWNDLKCSTVENFICESLINGI